MHPNAEPNDVKQGRRNVGRAGGGGKKVEGKETYEKQRKSLLVIRLVPMRGAKGLVSPKKILPLPERMFRI